MLPRRRSRSLRPRTCGGEVTAAAVPHPAEKQCQGLGRRRRQETPVLFIITTVAVRIYNAFIFRRRRRSPRRSSVAANVGQQPRRSTGLGRRAESSSDGQEEET